MYKCIVYFNIHFFFFFLKELPVLFLLTTQKHPICTLIILLLLQAASTSLSCSTFNLQLKIWFNFFNRYFYKRHLEWRFEWLSRGVQWIFMLEIKKRRREKRNSTSLTAIFIVRMYVSSAQ